jgi:hypothetical protein
MSNLRKTRKGFRWLDEGQNVYCRITRNFAIWQEEVAPKNRLPMVESWFDVDPLPT